MGAMWVRTALCGLLLAGVAVGCDRGGGDAGGELEVVDAGSQPPAVGRPEGVSVGPRVGVVVAATPDVRVLPSQGAPFPATEGMMLVRDDRLSTGSDAKSFVLVELYNGHLVRFNHGTSIVVAGISVFGSPRAGGDLAQRFEEQLRPEELGDEHLRGAISRVAGWNARMTAAETFAALPVEPAHGGQEGPKTGDSKAADVPERGLGKDDVDAPAPPSSSSPMDPPGTERDVKEPAGDQPNKPDTKKSGKKSDPLGKNTNSGDGGGGGPLEMKNPFESGTEPTKPKPRDEPPPSSLDLPSRVQFKPEAGPAETIDLPPALKVSRKALAACAGAGARVRVRVVKGVITEIRVEGGSGKPCSDGKNRGVKLADGWLEMRVQ